MRWAVRCLLLACCLAYVHSIGEVLNSKITVTPYNPACEAGKFARPCAPTYGNSKLTAADIPPDSPCPCPANGAAGGGYPGATGIPTIPNAEADFFIDEVLADGFDNPVALAFTDDSNELFVGTRSGIIHRVDLDTGLSNIFIDLSPEVGLSGDRGLMDVVAHPSYTDVQQILTMFTVDPNPGDGVEPNSESAVNQRLIRLGATPAGVAVEGFRLTLFGGPDGDGPPLCFNTHAVGSLLFGLDGSLFVTTGEGAHWNFDVGDWGQDSAFTIQDETGPQASLDAQCVARFGPEEDIGAFRAQEIDSLGGKVLRITPDTGLGICEGSGYPIFNPYCDNSGGSSKRSKVYALGLRNPFRATVRPLVPGEPYNGGPGVLYFGDVGQGGYEEINAVPFNTGMNFGWPCWEGPLPSPIYRDSPYNTDINAVTYGCPGQEGLCGNVTSIAYFESGERMTCRAIFHEVNTQLPFYYYSRFLELDNAGYFGEIGYTGTGVRGATIAGLQFYTGKQYPAKYVNQLFALEFSDLWIRVLFGEDDAFDHTEDFADLIYSDPVEGARHTLKAGPDGNMCYLTMNGGEVRCFRYVVTNVPPTPTITIETDAGLVPFAANFSSIRTFDRENDPILCNWNFGDGTVSDEINPIHTYTLPGTYTAILTCQDIFGNTANTTKQVYAGNARPVVSITGPVANLNNKVREIAPTDTIVFSANVVDPGDEGAHTFRWEVQFVHNNHIHPDELNIAEATWSRLASELPNEGVSERVNLRVICHVTDPSGLTGTDYIRLSPIDWETVFGQMRAPVPDFSFENGYLPLQAGQPIRFDAQNTTDLDGDRITYIWDFGDGFTGIGVTTTHMYNGGGTYQVTLRTEDNWGLDDSVTKAVIVAPLKALPPAVFPPAGERYNSFQVTMESIQAGAQIHYTTNGDEPTVASPIYDGTPLPFAFVPYTDVTIKAVSNLAPFDLSAVTTNNYQILPPPCNQFYLKQNCSLGCVNVEVPRAPSVVETLPSGQGLNNNGGPPNPDKFHRYLMTNLNGVKDENLDTTRLNLWVDGGSTPGQSIQVQVSYDFTNDGTYDRVELFNLFACDPTPNAYEEYKQDLLAQRFQSITGSQTYLPLVDGTVEVLMWQALGSGNPLMTVLMEDSIGTGDNFRFSTISIPYRDTYVSAPTECGTDCNGAKVADSCGTCAGPGPVGCDFQCFSEKVFDSCGICGGVGVTGCDFECNSTKVVDSCGICGANTTCTAPEDSYSCSRLAIRGNCTEPELICSTLNFNTDDYSISVPSSLGAGTQGSVPTDPSKVLSLEITGINGFYNIQSDLPGIEGHTIVEVYLDSGAIPGSAVQAQVQYDWTGDGIADRSELYDIMTPNDLVNFELFRSRGVPINVLPTGKLVSSTGAWSDLVDGIVRIKFWSAFNTLSNTLIRSDNGFPGATSLVRIPFVTAWAENTDRGCGNVTLVATTGVYTTGSATTGSSTFNTGTGTTGGTIPTTSTGTQSSGPTDCLLNSDCDVPTICHTVACVGGQCLETPSIGASCEGQLSEIGLCFTGECVSDAFGEVACASTGAGNRNCEADLSGVEQLFVPAFLLLASLALLL